MKIKVRIHTSHIEEIEVPDVWYYERTWDVGDSTDSVSYSKFTATRHGLLEIRIRYSREWLNKSPDTWELESRDHQGSHVDYQDLLGNGRMSEAKWVEKLTEFRAWMISTGFFGIVIVPDENDFTL